MGGFGDHDVLNEDAGFANLGTVWALSAGVKLGPHWGIAAAIRRQNHGFHHSAMVDVFDRNFPDHNWSAVSENHQMTSFMAGLFGDIPLSPKWTVDVSALFGLAIARYPTVTFTGDNPSTGTSTFVRQTSNPTHALAFQLGSSLRYQVTGQVSLLLRVDYWSAAPHTTVSTTSPSRETPLNVTFKQEMKTVSALIGVGFGF